jgi:hypothetical protein
VLASRGGGFGAGTPREGWDHAEPWLPHALAATGLEPGFITAELTLAEVNPAMAAVRPDRGCDEECRQEEKHAESKGDSGMTDLSTSARPNAVRMPEPSARLNASANSLLLPKPGRIRTCDARFRKPRHPTDIRPSRRQQATAVRPFLRLADLNQLLFVPTLNC